MIIYCLLTVLISSEVMAPGKSCLLANTNRLAPANLYNKNILCDFQNPKHLTNYNNITSCTKSVCSSALQSASLLRSALSTTHTTPSVDSK